MIDPKDGGLMFCWSKRGEVNMVSKTNKKAWREWAGCSICKKEPCSECNGKLLDEGEIKYYFSTLALNQKNKGKKKKRDNDD